MVVQRRLKTQVSATMGTFYLDGVGNEGVGRFDGSRAIISRFTGRFL